MKNIIQLFLASAARRVIRRYNPIVIGVTGSVGKTSTKEAIFTVLKKRYRVGKSEKSLNTEIGLPLAVLGAKNHYRNVFGWLGELASIAKKMVFGFDCPDVLVLEMGVQKPGDMDYLLSIVRPQIAVVTHIGDVPVHVEYFKDPEELIDEKARLVAALPDDGHAILCHDDVAVYSMREATKAPTLTFGLDAHASVRITNFELRILKDAARGDMLDGVSFKAEYQGSVVPIRLHSVFGGPHAYAASAAIAVGLSMGMNLLEISEALDEYVGSPGRLRLLSGNKRSFILDDTYNAAPESMRVALETLQELPGKRKIAVLGDMLELGKYTEQAHRAIGDLAAGFVDVLLCVGARAKFIADEAIERGMPRERVQTFNDSVSAGQALDPMLREGDLVLVKGSQGIRMEKAVLEIMAHPESAKTLLVRQDEYWTRH